MHVRLLEGPYKGDIFEVGSVGVLLDPDSDYETHYSLGDVEVIVWQKSTPARHLLPHEEPGDTETHWANGAPRLLTPEAYERLSRRNTA